MSADPEGVAQINYIVHPRSVERIDDNGDSTEREETDLYGDLVFAGYPITNDTTLGAYFIDLAVRGDQVVVFTSSPAVEHDMGPAGGLFLAWHARNGEEG